MEERVFNIGIMSLTKQQLESKEDLIKLLYEEIERLKSELQASQSKKSLGEKGKE